MTRLVKIWKDLSRRIPVAWRRLECGHKIALGKVSNLDNRIGDPIKCLSCDH